MVRLGHAHRHPGRRFRSLRFPRGKHPVHRRHRRRQSVPRHRRCQYHRKSVRGDILQWLRGHPAGRHHGRWHHGLQHHRRCHPGRRRHRHLCPHRRSGFFQSLECLPRRILQQHQRRAGSGGCQPHRRHPPGERFSPHLHRYPRRIRRAHPGGHRTNRRRHCGRHGEPARHRHGPSRVCHQPHGRSHHRPIGQLHQHRPGQARRPFHRYLCFRWRPHPHRRPDRTGWQALHQQPEDHPRLPGRFRFQSNRRRQRSHHLGRCAGPVGNHLAVGRRQLRPHSDGRIRPQRRLGQPGPPDF